MTTQPTETATADNAQLEADKLEADDSQPRGNHEAAKYRRRLREVEAERDTAAERLAAMQRREVERLAGGEGALADGSDLFAFGAELADLLDAETGLPDESKVTEAVKTLAGQRPHLARESEAGLRRSPFQPRLTTGMERDDAAPTWHGVLSSARRPAEDI